MRSRTFLLGFGVLALTSYGCANILSVQDIVPLDAGVIYGEDGAVIADGVPECVRDSECDAKLPQTVSGDRCADAKCRANRCTFVAHDQDGDGFTVACASNDPQRPIVQSASLDCDDGASGIVANSEIDCTDGSFTLPGRGECRAGKKRCNPDGTFSACVGAIGKKLEACNNSSDDDCDGIVNNGCTCSPGDTQPCGVSAVGLCRKGTQSCVGGVWAATCVGAVFPAARNCTSANDNDCNGTPDNAEASCLCSGTASAGSKRACVTGLAGICGPGTETCVVTPTGASWGGCVGSTGPQSRECSSLGDNDCNGTGDQLETLCKCGGVYLVGSTTKCAANGTRTCEANGSTAMWVCDSLQ